MRKLLLTLIFVIPICACTSHDRASEPFYVSILPLRTLVQGIVGDDFPVEVLVPPGASPETFEPSARQYAALNRARLIFQVGWIDFEGALLSKMPDQEKIVNLSEGIDPIAGSCSHAAQHSRNEGDHTICGHNSAQTDHAEYPTGQNGNDEDGLTSEHYRNEGDHTICGHNSAQTDHAEYPAGQNGNDEDGSTSEHYRNEGQHDSQQNSTQIDNHRRSSPDAPTGRNRPDAHSHHGHDHAHGIDPHVWTSPRALQRMASNAYRAIHRLYPDSVKYTENYRLLRDSLERLDRRIGAKIAESGVDYFMIYHPALTYYARDYGIRQVAIEQEGKEPSAKRLAGLIRQARADSVRRIFYQRQFPRSTVEAIARDMGAVPTEIDPLREDIFANLLEITDSITSQR